LAIKRERQFLEGTDRYQFDFGPCAPAQGFAQVDTSQDAWYYGNWANPFTFTFVSYAEGDLDTTVADTPEEFRTVIREFVEWNNAERDRFKGIDSMLDERIEQAFRDLGLGEYLY
jgi:hypothetical protein